MATVENTRGRLSELQNSGQNQNDIVLGNLTKPTSEHALAGTAITVIDTSLPERLQPTLLLLGCMGLISNQLTAAEAFWVVLMRLSLLN